MQDWRFDDLTRTLGRATSRRGVIKGLVGGLAAVAIGRSVGAPSAEAANCNKQACREAAMRETIFYQTTTCHSICSDRRLLLGCISCRINANRLFYKLLRDCNTGDGCLSTLGQVCCGTSCVNTSGDPQNCGSCGNACDPGATCENGQCTCADNQTRCDDHCVDTQTDHNNCGDCGHACGECQTCSGGQCVDKVCAEGTICCKGNCVPLCFNGDHPDPTTCQCNICQNQIDGAACDANDNTKLCCQEQCVSNQCPQGKEFSLDTCTCQCTATCPDGQLQDPETCACQDLCANVTCNECSSCDPTSGDCVPVADQTPCGSGQVCCSGTCQDSCSGNCPSGQYTCGVTQPYNNNNNQRPDSVCCDNGTACCGGNGYFYEICGGSTYNDQYVCCAPGTNQCGGNCCDHETQSCQGDASIGYYCCPAGSHGVLSDGTCCGAGEGPVGCYGEGCVSDTVCCPVGSGGALPDGTCCDAGASVFLCCTDTPSYACCVGGNCCCN